MGKNNPSRYYVDQNKIPDLFPTHTHDPAFWESLGRTIAAFGFLEEILGKAIFAYTATREYDEYEVYEAYNKWLPKLKKALCDSLGRLINDYEIAVRAHHEVVIDDHFNDLISQLRKAKKTRDVLCHGSWRPPDSSGASIPFFVNQKMEIFDSPMSQMHIDQLRQDAVHLACEVINSVTKMGWQFPGSTGPGEKIQ